MSTKSAWFILAVIVALAAWFALRQQTLQDLRARNDSLRRQMDAGKSAGVMTAAKPPATSVARLSDADERELLQLRSRIGPLRQQLLDASNRVGHLQSFVSGAPSSSVGRP